MGNRLSRGGWVWMSVAAVWLLGAAVSAGQTALRRPVAVAYDSAGNLFVADSGRNQVFEFAASGTVSVVAGTGAQGFGGDGGAAAEALLNAPMGVAVSADGTTVYIADTGNHRVRAVVRGVISTAAGTGVAGFGGDGGAATAARLRSPVGVALSADGASLFVADVADHRVRRVAGGVISTLVGTGVQGFGGDGGMATAALLDSPGGVAAGSDGRVFVADTRNERVRVVGLDGVVRTLAGTGVAGFAGDAGPAIAAALDGPRGLAVSAAGVVYVADTGNRRVRAVGLDGVMTTVAGSGVQGLASAAGAPAVGSVLDAPMGVAIAASGLVAVADAGSAQVNVVALDGTLAVVGGRAAAVTVSVGAGGLVYGSGAVSVTVAGSGPAAVGSVTLTESGAVVGTGVVVAGTASVPVGSLAAGTHSLVASYGGDGIHAAGVSAAVPVVVAPLAVVATADDAEISYGGYTPALTGKLAGVLPRDAGAVVPVFATSAPDLAAVGLYPITASLTGSASGNYSVTMASGSGHFMVTKAVPLVAFTTQGSVAGLPMVLTERVSAAVRGTPTGVVQFLDGGSVVATGTVVGGVESAVWASPAAGSHSLTAVYAGDANFAGASAVLMVAVGAMPDFALAGSAAQTVQGGGIATYAVMVSPVGGAFSGSVVMSATGLPPGAKVSFAPGSVVPGAGTVPVVVSIQTVAATGRFDGRRGDVRWALVMLGGLALAARRRRFTRSMLVGLVMVGLAGCGARTVGSTATPKTYEVVVTGTGTDLAGAVVARSCTLGLTVE